MNAELSRAAETQRFRAASVARATSQLSAEQIAAATRALSTVAVRTIVLVEGAQ